MGHFHIHVIARKPNDFDDPNDVYKFLNDYDKE